MIRHGRRHEVWRAAVWGAATVVLVAIMAGVALSAADPASDARQLSSQAQGFLSRITKSEKDATGSLIGAVAGFAGDAQTLAGALTRADATGAGAALVSLEQDRTAVDAAIAANSGVADPAEWIALKNQLDHLIGEMSHDSTAAGESSVPAHGDAGVGGPGGTPRVVIESRAMDGNALRVKGWLEGRNLSAAGIYEGGSRLMAFNLDKVPGMQRVSFDLRVGNVRPGVVVRVIEADGTSAEAALEPDESRAAVASPVASSPEVEVPPAALTSGDEPGATDDKAPADTESRNTIEIPTHGPAAYEPDAATTALNGVRINIASVTMVSAMPRRWEVVGQIAGAGVRRAGIYVNGRLARNITISYGVPVSNFTAVFDMMTGSATIRAFGLGDQYVETAIQPGAFGPPIGGPGSYAGANPYAPSAPPYGYPNPPVYGAPHYPYGYGGAPYPYANPYPVAPQPPWWQRFIP